MLYKENLEGLIFHRHAHLEADELVIVSGYVGPSVVRRLKGLPIESTVVYGMYGSDGIKAQLHDSLVSLQKSANNLRIFYSNLPVHSKCYVWRRKGKVVYALLGSANFSRNGLCTPFREVLAETTSDTFQPLNEYVTAILNQSSSCLEVAPDVRTVSSYSTDRTAACVLTLLDPRKNEVPLVSGLNWGQNPKNHTRPNDAYFAIRVSHILKHPDLFRPKEMFSTDSRGRANRHNDAVELIWDDGVSMEALFEGSQPVNGAIYPKQLSSFPGKSQLGEYVRNRIGVALGMPVRKFHLDKYGRTNVEINLLGEGVYGVDFSVPLENEFRQSLGGLARPSL